LLHDISAPLGNTERDRVTLLGGPLLRRADGARVIVIVICFFLWSM
jgi:hypothetical protein